jgi:DNA-directed RNA polymerase-3 subunit RPC5
VQLRTQFHHIDASAQLEAVSRRREKESQEGTKPAEPKAFLPTVKKTGGDTPAELNQAFMKAANQEPWLKLNYTDENEQAAFDAYNDRLFLHDTALTPKLRANVTNSEYLDSISGRSGNKPKKRAANDVVEISEDDDGDAASADESVS